MARLVALLVLIVAACAVYAYSPQSQQCGPNEDWNYCASPKSCEFKCNVSPPIICPAVCVARCECRKGYLRNQDELCVLSRYC